MSDCEKPTTEWERSLYLELQGHVVGAVWCQSLDATSSETWSRALRLIKLHKRTAKRENKTMRFHTSASYYGSDRLEALGPFRQVQRKTQLVLSRCAPPRSPQAWWLALRLRSGSHPSILFCFRRPHPHGEGDDIGVVTAGASATYSLYSGSRVAFLSLSIMPHVGLVLNESQALRPHRQ